MSNLCNRPIYQKAQRKAPVAPRVDRSDAIRKSAEGQQCQADWCGCGGSTATTVFCHVRKFGLAGTGQKPADFLGFYGCFKAHLMFDEGDQWSWEGLLRAVFKTQILLNRAGLLNVS